MAADETVNIGFRADIGNLTKQLGKLDGITAGEAKKMVIALEKQMKRAESAAKSAAKNSETAWTTGFSKLGKGAGFGGLTEKIGNIGGAIAELGPEAIIAAAAAAVAFGGVAAAAYAAEEAASFVWSKGFAESKTAQENIGAVNSAWKDFGEEVGKRAGPAVQEVTLVLEAMALQLKDGADMTLEAYDAVSKYLPSLQTMVDTFAEINPELDKYLDKATEMTDELRKQQKAMSALAAFSKDVTKGIAEGEKELTKATSKEIDARTKARQKAAEDAKTAAEDAAQFEIDRATTVAEMFRKADDEAADAAIAAQAAAQAATQANSEAAIQAAQDVNAARQAANAADLQGDADYAAQCKATNAEIVSTSLDAASQLISAAQSVADYETKLHQDKLDRLRKERKDLQDNAKSADANVRLSAEAEIAGINERAKHEKKALMQAFRAKQAAGISAIGISTAEAVMQALAQLGPVAGGIAAGAVTATGITQAALIAAEKPPKFHRGTSNARGSGAPEFGAAIAHGEGVVTQSGMAKPGAKQTVDALNGQGGGAGAIIVPLYFEGRHIDDLVANAVVGGPKTKRALRAMMRGH